MIAEPLFRVKYVEKARTHTTDMIADCRKAGLPEPDFEQRGPHFVVTVWRDWLTKEVIGSLDLNERQRQAVLIVKTGKKLSNKIYQRAFDVSKPTASRDLKGLVGQGVLKKVGSTGKGTHYIVDLKGLIKGSKGSSGNSEGKGS